MGAFEGDVFDVFLKPYFFENYRPVHAGEVFPVYNKELDMTVSFKIMQIDDEETGAPRALALSLHTRLQSMSSSLEALDPNTYPTPRADYGVVAPETVVYTEGDPLDREADPSYNPSEIGYDDIGGLGKQISQVWGGVGSVCGGVCVLRVGKQSARKSSAEEGKELCGGGERAR
jgi:transitional endoplasmic reticulum ATPase